MTRRINDTTVVHSPTDSQLLTRRPHLVRVRTELTDTDGTPGTTLIVGWPETDGWESVNWSGTIGNIAALLACAGVILFKRNYASRAQVAELSQAIREAAPRPHLEVVFDRLEPTGDAALWLIGALRTGAARTALDVLDGVTR